MKRLSEQNEEAYRSRSNQPFPATENELIVALGIAIAAMVAVTALVIVLERNLLVPAGTLATLTPTLPAIFWFAWRLTHSHRWDAPTKRDIGINSMVLPDQAATADPVAMKDSARIERSDGSVEWYENECLHRSDGPAVERADGTVKWYAHGRLHRDGAPAVVMPDGTQAWYCNGKLHRIGGPAVESADGSREWWLHGNEVAQRVAEQRSTEGGASETAAA